MPHLRAFRALRYDPLAVPEAGAVLCPPYDVISAERRERLAARHPRNAVHVELPVAADDTSTGKSDDRYAAAGRLFAEWRRDGSLRRDPRPFVYAYEQRYVLSGIERAARGFLCRLRLEELGPESGVRAHERTMGAPKEDRYRLLSAVRANLSPVLLLYQTDDAGRSSADLLDELMAAAPEVETVDDAGATHRLWLADPQESAAAAALLQLAGSQPVTIADGHHRYETALRWRDQQRSARGNGSDEGEHAHECVLSLLYDAASGGLTVLPTHRLLRRLPGTGRDLLERAGRLFDSAPRDDAASMVDELDESGRIGLWTRDGAALLTVDRQRLAPLAPAGTSDALRWLDVSVLDVALQALAGAPAADLVAAGEMVYTKDPREAVELVGDGRMQAAFLLPPTPISTVLQIAATGEVMPQKSTYFEPKAATGLVFNPVAE